MIDTLVLARKNRGLTQTQIAKKISKHQSYIAKIEGCERKLDILEFVVLCRVIGIQADEVLKALDDVEIIL